MRFPAPRAALVAVAAVVVPAVILSAAGPALAEDGRTCPQCGREALHDWKFCPADGAALPRTPAPLLRVLGWDVTVDRIWLAIGFSGQAAFAMRFFLQWLASERKGESVVPPAFWWVSLLAGLMVLAYGLYKMEPVIILSQAFNPVIYLRNIMLIRRKERLQRTMAAEAEAAAAAPPGTAMAGATGATAAGAAGATVSAGATGAASRPSAV
jgi:lipid-A-disaccharide synthase-like uncharacterized protein